MPALAGARTRRRAVLPAAVVAALLIAATPASAAVVFDAGPGAGPAPDTLGPYSLNAYPEEPRLSGTVHDAPATSGSLLFSRAMSLRRIRDDSWFSGPWAGGTYDGAVYWNLGGGPTTITLTEPQPAFYLYAQTDYYGTYAMVATAQDGTTSGEIQATTGPGGPNAKFFGFYGTGDDLISSVTISSPEADDDFAVGNFGGGSSATGPLVDQITGDASVPEGATEPYAVSASDQGGRPLQYAWSVTSGPGTISGSAAGPTADVRVDDGPAAVCLQVVITDADGKAVTRRFTIHASNVVAAAHLAARNDQQVDEGQARIYAYAIDDPGDDTVERVDASCGEGATKVEGYESNSEIGGSFECRFPDGPAEPSVTVAVTDSDGDTGARDDQPVAVQDVAPVLTFAASDLRVDEGSTRLYPYTLADPGDDDLSVDAACGEGGEKVPGSERNTRTTGSFECTFPDGMTSAVVSAVPTDSDEATGADDAQVVAVDNVPPAVRIVGGGQVHVEQGPAAHLVEYTMEDPGRDSVVAVETSCGQGGAKVPGSERHSDTAGSFACDLGGAATTSAVTVRATDSDGDSGVADIQEVIVGTGTPLAALSPSNTTTVNESASERKFAYSIGGPGTEPIATLETSCGAEGVKVPGSDVRTSRAGKFRCVFRDGPATSGVSVMASTAAHQMTTDTQHVTILDPQIRASGRRIAGVENRELNRKIARFTDPTPYSRPDEYDATIDWGDGSATSDGTISKSGDGSLAVRGAHTYKRLRAGGYAIAVTVADADNPANTATAASRAAIADADIHVRDADITTTAAFQGTVATFRDDGDGPESDFSATIAWGDGSRSAGTITRADDGTFAVGGSHVYPRSGSFDAGVRVESIGGSRDRGWADALVYAFASSGGATFAIGDARATTGTGVTFWGSSWPRLNGLASGALVDSAFRGFVTAQPGHAIPRCGDTWTTAASSGPPADVPPYMGVVVTGKLTKSGSTFAGTVRKVVVVKTDSGYRPDPSRAGAGRVVAVVCG